MTKITFTRKELYNLVWSKPMIKIANEYSISDNGLRKICRRMKIPLPQQGHWQKVEYGKKANKIILPKKYDGDKSITLIERVGEYNTNKQSQFSILKSEVEALNTYSLVVPDKLSKPDKLIITARKSLLVNKPSMQHNQEGLVNTNRNEINIVVSPGSIRRSLRFMDTLIKLLKKRGHKVVIGSDGVTYAVIRNEEIQIQLKEKLKRVIIDNGSWKRQELHPTGKLAFRYGWFNKREVVDGKSLFLEERLSFILAKLELKAKKEKELRLEREAYHNKVEEENKRKIFIQKQKNDELEKFKNLFASAKLLHEANTIREYANTVRVKALKNNNLSKEVKKWLEWVEKKADWYDPLIDFDDDLLKEVDKETLKFNKSYQGW